MLVSGLNLFFLISSITIFNFKSFARKLLTYFTDLHDEIFGPVISIYKCQDQLEAITIENNNAYGNAACIYTTTGATAERFTSRFSAGMIGVNIGVPVPREPFSFGGWNKSKFGNSDITGDGAIEFFTQTKVIIERWPNIWSRKF